MRIQRRASKGKATAQTQNKPNQAIAKVRAHVEHVLAGLVHMGRNAARTIGLARATLRLSCEVAAYNLQRLVYLKGARVEAF